MNNRFFSNGMQIYALFFTLQIFLNIFCKIFSIIFSKIFNILIFNTLKNDDFLTFFEDLKEKLNNKKVYIEIVPGNHDKCQSQMDSVIINKYILNAGSHINIPHISGRCGYKSFSNFSRDFKRRCGVSPNIYRREKRNLLLYI